MPRAASANLALALTGAFKEKGWGVRMIADFAAEQGPCRTCACLLTNGVVRAVQQVQGRVSQVGRKSVGQFVLRDEEVGAA